MKEVLKALGFVSQRDVYHTVVWLLHPTDPCKVGEAKALGHNAEIPALRAITQLGVKDVEWDTVTCMHSMAFKGTVAGQEVWGCTSFAEEKRIADLALGNLLLRIGKVGKA